MNLMIPNGSVTVTPGSKVKNTTRKGDSGGDLVYHMCEDVSSNHSGPDRHWGFAARIGNLSFLRLIKN